MAKPSPTQLTTISFRVLGRPQQRGSKRPVRRGVNGTILLIDDNPNSKAWMDSVRFAAAATVDYLWEPVRCPIKLSAVFWFARPKSHYGTGKNEGCLKANAPRMYAQTPDLSKLVRAIEDAMTGIIYADDRQICRYGEIRKAWTTGMEMAEIDLELFTAADAAKE